MGVPDRERPDDRRRLLGAAAPGGPFRTAPLVMLGGYYAALITVGGVLIYFSPFLRNAWVSASMETGITADVFSGRTPIAGVEVGRPLVRSLTVAAVTIGALTLALPIAWVYAATRRLRYDPSLVHSMIVLPMVVPGIVMIVKDSIALAFSLAGIVAVVRFRNTLKDPKDAVYVFLALGLGLAAGVQALDVALVMSLLFNLMVLVLWKNNLGALYSGATGSELAIGDSTLFIARTAMQRDALRWRFTQEAGEQADGILVVHTRDPDAARHSIELAVSRVADQWRIASNFRRRAGVSTFAVVLRLQKKADAVALLDEIEERWRNAISAAEYIPLNHELPEPAKPVATPDTEPAHALPKPET